MWKWNSSECHQLYIGYSSLLRTSLVWRRRKHFGSCQGWVFAWPSQRRWNSWPLPDASRIRPPFQVSVRNWTADPCGRLLGWIRFRECRIVGNGRTVMVSAGRRFSALVRNDGLLVLHRHQQLSHVPDTIVPQMGDMVVPARMARLRGLSARPLCSPKQSGPEDCLFNERARSTSGLAKIVASQVRCGVGMTCARTVAYSVDLHRYWSHKGHSKVTFPRWAPDSVDRCIEPLGSTLPASRAICTIMKGELVQNCRQFLFRISWCVCQFAGIRFQEESEETDRNKRPARQNWGLVSPSPPACHNHVCELFNYQHGSVIYGESF